MNSPALVSLRVPVDTTFGELRVLLAAEIKVPAGTLLLCTMFRDEVMRPEVVAQPVLFEKDPISRMMRGDIVHAFRSEVCV